MPGPGPIGNKSVPDTSTPQPSEVGGNPQVEPTKTGQQPPQTGGPGTAPATPPSPEQVKGAKEHAADKMVDSKLGTHARGLVPPRTKEQQIKSIGEQAKILGLEKAEITKLTDRLKGMNDADFKKECAFLNNHVLGVDGNSDRGLRTYNELKNLQANGRGRVTDEHIHTLTRGVVEARSKWEKGWEGVMGQQGAVNAAKALIKMPKADYDAINKSLDQAGKGADGKQVPGSSPQIEKALILKAAGAHHDELGKPTKQDRLANLNGTPSAMMSTIEQFAKDIRGTQKNTLVQQSTATDPYGGDKALQQRWNDSCGPTTAHAMRAELDPIYARKLHQEFIHGTSEGGDIAAQQKTDLQAAGGIAVSRDTPGGAGSKLDDVLNNVCTIYTGVKYRAKSAGESEKSRKAALDAAATDLKKGIDVPIRVQWKSGGGHFMILTDVRGEGKNQLFLLTDPWKGQTVWISRDQLASGKTPTPAGTGRLTHTY